MTTLTAETTVREMDNKMRKELNAHRRVDAPPGLVYLYKQDEPPYGAVPLGTQRQYYRHAIPQHYTANLRADR